MAHVIRNFEALATAPEREDALSIAEAGYAGISTRGVISRKMRVGGDELLVGDRRYPLSGRRVFFVGVGKCAIAAARAIEDLLGDRLTAGIALDVSPAGVDKPNRIEVIVGTHPEPSEVNVEASNRVIEFLSHCAEEDLVLMLISGGGSTLLCRPDAPMTCLDERMLFEELTNRGAKIQEVNIVRKHISGVRGGGLAKAAYPAEIVSLIISDVPANNIEYISSGPSVRDDSTIGDAGDVLARYKISLPAGAQFIETPKEEKYFERVENILIMTSRDALDAMSAEAERRGYNAEIVTDCITGEAQEVGRYILEKLHAAPEKSVLLFAGETTVALGNTSGTGGRNQELALSALADIHADELILPFASDGRDNTDHAGAIADAATRAHAEQHGASIAEHLSAHTSYTFFVATGDFLDTGYTGSNVSDLIIALKN